MLLPCKSGIFGKRSLRRKAVYVADLGNDTGGIDKTDTFYGSKGVGNRWQLLSNGFVVLLDLSL